MYTTNKCTTFFTICLSNDFSMTELHISSLPLNPEGCAVFYDVEYTSWKGYRESNWSMPGKYMEIVQIGALRIDFDQDWKELDQFVAYVQPRRNPELSDYFIDLTGITQEIVDEQGTDFETALRNFVDYVIRDNSPLASHGPDHEVIQLNCEFNDLDLPAPFQSAINLRPWISGQVGVAEATYTSSELPDAVGVVHAETAHNGVADSRAIASVLRHLYLHLTDTTS
jgi:inhibitor of KinA sporulation pathway (predicted exonuclease)